MAGPYSSHSNDPGNPFDAPVEDTDARIVAWADSVQDYSPAPGVDVGFSDAVKALGPPGAPSDIVSLGDLDQSQITAGVTPGTITLGFGRPITNAAGHDFAVFENSFVFQDDPSKVFAELAYVEVSTNGSDFARFESVSLETEAELHTPFGRDFAGVDPTDYFNLAGKHAAGWGTPFDLANLSSDPLVLSGEVDLLSINFVRLIDLPGSGDFLDASGNPIFDAWITTGSGGLDLNGIGVLNQSPEPSAGLMLTVSGVLMLISSRKRLG